MSDPLSIGSRNRILSFLFKEQLGAGDPREQARYSHSPSSTHRLAKKLGGGGGSEKEAQEGSYEQSHRETSVQLGSCMLHQKAGILELFPRDLILNNFSLSLMWILTRALTE